MQNNLFKAQLITRYDDSKNNPSLYPQSQLIVSLTAFWLACLLTKYFFSFFFFFVYIRNSQDSRGRRRPSFQLISTTSTRFTKTQTLAERLLRKAHLCAQLAAGLEPRTFGSKLSCAPYYLLAKASMTIAKISLHCILKVTDIRIFSSIFTNSFAIGGVCKRLLVEMS